MSAGAPGRLGLKFVGPASLVAVQSCRRCAVLWVGEVKVALVAPESAAVPATA